MVPYSSLHISPPRVKHFQSKVSQPTSIVTTLHGMNLSPSKRSQKAFLAHLSALGYINYMEIFCVLSYQAVGFLTSLSSREQR